jgi:hypothetical protein
LIDGNKSSLVLGFGEANFKKMKWTPVLRRNAFFEAEAADAEGRVGAEDAAVAGGGDPVEAVAAVPGKLGAEEPAAALLRLEQRLARHERSEAVEDEEADAVDEAALEAEVGVGPVDEGDPAEEVAQGERNLGSDSCRSVPEIE